MNPTVFKILIVDDNEASAKTLGWMMELLGHDYRCAFSAHDALELSKTFCPDIILLDIGLPLMNGYELCATLKKDPALAHAVYIAQTGWGQIEHRQRSKDVGFDYHFVKPVQLEQIQKVLDSLAAPVLEKTA